MSVLECALRFRMHCFPYYAVSGARHRALNAKAREVTVIDALGRRQSRVTCSIHCVHCADNTEILFALGLGDRVIGVTEACDYPPDAKSKPKVGQVEMNIEKIVEMSPDLVVAVASMQLPVVRTLSGLGIPVLALDPKTLPDLLDSITLVGKATGQRKPQACLRRNLGKRFKIFSQRQLKL